GRPAWRPGPWSNREPCSVWSATPATRGPRHRTCTTASTPATVRWIRCRACARIRQRPERVERSIVAGGLVPAASGAYGGSTLLLDPQHGSSAEALPHHRHPGRVRGAALPGPLRHRVRTALRG